MEAPPARLIVGITGSSGAVCGVRLLRRLRELPVETHLIVSRWARVTIEHELQIGFDEVRALADVVDYTVLRMLDQVELGPESSARWPGLPDPARSG